MTDGIHPQFKPNYERKITSLQPEKLVLMKPYRQKWLTPELLHSSPTAVLGMIGGEQWCQLEHPRGGPLGCIRNRHATYAIATTKIGGKWHWILE